MNAAEQICSYLDEEASLFSQYLAITQRMKDACAAKETGSLRGLLSERQACIRKIDRVGALIERDTPETNSVLGQLTGTLRESIANHLAKMRNMMALIESLDRELTDALQEEGASIRNELRRIQHSKQVGKSYRSKASHTPRFVNIES